MSPIPNPKLYEDGEGGPFKKEAGEGICYLDDSRWWGTGESSSKRRNHSEAEVCRSVLLRS